ncbi:hypothetical protein EBZ39_00130 [bacterium]|nr:hypothetical protein [bacterium]
MESSEKKQLTYGMVTAGLKLSPLQLRGIFTNVLQKSMPAPDTLIEPPDLFCLLVADTLEKVPAMQSEQRSFLLREMRDLFDTAPPQDLLHLMFVDSRYSVWTGHTGYLDLETGETIPAIPTVPMISIGYNLTELYRQGVLMLETRNGFHGKKSDPGSVDKPGDVRGGTPDAVS